jgi:hypothetical protein
MLLGDLFLDLEGGVEVEVVDELQRLADGRGEIEWVCMEGGLGRGGEREKDRGEQEGESEKEWQTAISQFKGQSVGSSQTGQHGRRR